MKGNVWDFTHLSLGYQIILNTPGKFILVQSWPLKKDKKIKCCRTDLEIAHQISIKSGFGWERDVFLLVFSVLRNIIR